MHPTDSTSRGNQIQVFQNQFDGLQELLIGKQLEIYSSFIDNIFGKEREKIVEEIRQVLAKDNSLSDEHFSNFLDNLKNGIPPYLSLLMAREAGYIFDEHKYPEEDCKEWLKILDQNKLSSPQFCLLLGINQSIPVFRLRLIVHFFSEEHFASLNEKQSQDFFNQIEVNRTDRMYAQFCSIKYPEQSEIINQFTPTLQKISKDAFKVLVRSLSNGVPFIKALLGALDPDSWKTLYPDYPDFYFPLEGNSEEIFEHLLFITNDGISLKDVNLTLFIDKLQNKRIPPYKAFILAQFSVVTLENVPEKFCRDFLIEMSSLNFTDSQFECLLRYFEKDENFKDFQGLTLALKKAVNYQIYLKRLNEEEFINFFTNPYIGTLSQLVRLEDVSEKLCQELLRLLENRNLSKKQFEFLLYFVTENLELSSVKSLSNLIDSVSNLINKYELRLEKDEDNLLLNNLLIGKSVNQSLLLYFFPDLNTEEFAENFPEKLCEQLVESFLNKEIESTQFELLLNLVNDQKINQETAKKALLEIKVIVKEHFSQLDDDEFENLLTRYSSGMVGYTALFSAVFSDFDKNHFSDERCQKWLEIYNRSRLDKDTFKGLLEKFQDSNLSKMTIKDIKYSIEFFLCLKKEAIDDELVNFLVSFLKDESRFRKFVSEAPEETCEAIIQLHASGEDFERLINCLSRYPTSKHLAYINWIRSQLEAPNEPSLLETLLLDRVLENYQENVNVAKFISYQIRELSPFQQQSVYNSSQDLDWHQRILKVVFPGLDERELRSYNLNGSIALMSGLSLEFVKNNSFDLIPLSMLTSKDLICFEEDCLTQFLENLKNSTPPYESLFRARWPEYPDVIKFDEQIYKNIIKSYGSYLKKIDSSEIFDQALEKIFNEISINPAIIYSVFGTYGLCTFRNNQWAENIHSIANSCPSRVIALNEYGDSNLGSLLESFSDKICVFIVKRNVDLRQIAKNHGSDVSKVLEAMCNDIYSREFFIQIRDELKREDHQYLLEIHESLMGSFNSKDWRDIRNKESFICALVSQMIKVETLPVVNGEDELLQIWQRLIKGESLKAILSQDN